MSRTAQEPLVDPAAILAAMKAIIAPGQVVEVRAFEAALDGSNYKHKTVSGYFDDMEKLAVATCSITQADGIYFTPNPVKPALLAKAVNKIQGLKGKDSTTSDSQIERRAWLLVDCDSQKEITGISATDEEHELALARAIAVDAYLSDHGWPAGIRGDSGNGGHIMYAIDEPADDDGLVKGCLEALADKFDDDRVKVDVTVFNPSRIWRLYGAINGKGDAEAAKLGRPHRRAKLLSVPDVVEIISTEKLRALAALAPPPPDPPSRHNHNGHATGKPWDMEEFISRHGIAIHSRGTWKNATKWTLEACPNNPEHTAPDAALYQFSDGALKFKCSHNSCASFRWEQFRQLHDPGCYDRRNDYQQNGNQHNGSSKVWGTKEESESHHPWEQVGPPLSLEELEDQFPELPPAIIHGLLREGETANIIAASKVGKSWLMYEIGLCVATGKRIWDTYGTVPGGVLLIDNELREEVLSFRLKLVRKAMGLTADDLKNEDGTGKLAVRSLRGRLLDIHGIAAWLRKHVKPGQYKLIIIDAYYRILPAEMSENDNNPTTQLYNLLDALSLELGCAFALVHHASKGSQTGKAITDVGSGAGAMSRAADCHMVLRPHEEPGVVVKEVAVRSWPPAEPLCLRYIHPRWVVADGLDPAALKPDKVKTTINQIADRAWDWLKEHGPNLRAKWRAGVQISGEKINEVVELLLLQKRIEPVDIPKNNGFNTGYQVTGTAVDNAGQSTSPDTAGVGAGLPKGKSVQQPSPVVHMEDEQSSSPSGDADNA